ncbi:MAG: DUF3883 domain-containing protein [Gammaproteobacteria bacterium]|nr:DUF3883 domain-containing protein [Gammaproteobacteria bacterium]
MTGDWLSNEVEEAVSDYLTMLRLELADEPFNKAEHNRQLQEALPERSRGSIEFKHQNISAVLIELGYPYVEGYKPRGNYQELLREVVLARLAEDSGLSALVLQVVDGPVDAPPEVDELLGILVDPPEPEKADRTREPRRPLARIGRQPNYLEIEARNRSLGLAGEELVMQFEHRRLWTANKKSLAERIEHVSRTQGDGLGYDIESFEESGQPRLIEVKTTRFGALTPFFVSRNEVQVSVERQDDYSLYRVFDFRSKPRIFTLPGSLDGSCVLNPVQYRASVR